MMIKNISRSRKEYERAYQWLRWTKGSTQYRMFKDVGIDSLTCAILSYDYRTVGFSGWDNHQRRDRFQLGINKQCWKWGGIPF